MTKEIKNTKERKILNVTGHSKIFYTISCSLIALFIILTAVIGLNVDIAFKGGTILTYSYTGDISDSDVSKIVSDTLNLKATVTKGKNTATSQKTVKIQFASTKGISDDKQTALKAALVENFPDNEIEPFETNDVSASNGMDFFLKCLAACALAAVITIIYIGFRFKKIGGISAGVFSVVALIHDMCMVYGCFVICRFDINANFMAVLLTILGYSINATIIIYDRIRENQNLKGKSIELDELVNLSITQTMGRSINTTVTTVAAMTTVCIVCLVFNVTSIISFAFPLIIGMIAGVYSSNCIAPTLWVHWKKHQAKKKALEDKSSKKKTASKGRR